MVYQRKTKDVYNLVSNYGYGWEIELTEYTKKEALDRLKEYRANGSGQYRIEKKRIPINA